MTTPDSPPSTPGAALRAERPRIICLCGSTRFIEQFAILTWLLERQGAIVLGCTLLPMWFCGVASHFGEATGTKEQCDEHHKRKIDLADEVLVIDIGGYIGESTRGEIEYATQQGKPLRYLSADPELLSAALPPEGVERHQPALRALIAEMRRVGAAWTADPCVADDQADAPAVWADELETILAALPPEGRHLVAVAGRFDRTLADFERSCLVHIDEEQQLANPDNALIALLCDAVRLTREHVEALQVAPEGRSPAEKRERTLCQSCNGNGTVKIAGGIMVCGRCQGWCWEPDRAAEGRPPEDKRLAEKLHDWLDQFGTPRTVPCADGSDDAVLWLTTRIRKLAEGRQDPEDLRELARQMAGMGISWNARAGSEIDGDPLRLWDEEGEPIHEHPWIQGQVLARKNAAAMLTEFLDKHQSSAEGRAPTSSQEPDWRRMYQDESIIVDNVWGALGISTYEQAQGKDVATIVSELRAEVLTLRQLGEGRAPTELQQALADFGQQLAASQRDLPEDAAKVLRDLPLEEEK